MADPLLIQMLKTNLRYQSQRQETLARNVSQIDTPGYHERDLKKLDFGKMLASNNSTMRTTNAKHMTGPNGGAGQFGDEKVRKPYEESPVANTVILEEQMAKISDTGTQYELSTSMLKKYSAMYKLALGNY